MQGRVLIIAGSDSGGGAGIQADIKSVTGLGGYAMTAITALTVQDTKGVHEIYDVPTDFIMDQIRVVVQDIGVDCIKTGMLHRVEVVEVVSQAIQQYARQVPIIVDPVMIAKGGATLLEQSAIGAIKELIIPYTTLLTPNIPEASALAGIEITTPEEAIVAARKLSELGPESVMITGGHLNSHIGIVSDVVLYADDSIEIFESKRIETRHTHGTGCTLASSIATGIAGGAGMREAIVQARHYVYQAILNAPGFGAGNGPLNHAHIFQKNG